MGSNSARLDALERAVARRWIELAELKIALDELKIALDASAANVAKTASVMFAQLDEIARTTREEVAAAKRDVAEARTVLEDDKAHLSPPPDGAADHTARAVSEIYSERIVNGV